MQPKIVPLIDLCNAAMASGQHLRVPGDTIWVGRSKIVAVCGGHLKDSQLAAWQFTHSKVEICAGSAWYSTCFGSGRKNQTHHSLARPPAEQIHHYILHLWHDGALWSTLI